MFDIGFLEIALISIIALLVVGPERLPKMVRTIGLWMGRIRRYINQAKNDIDREVRLQEWKEQLAKPASEFTQLREAANETTEVFKEAKSAIESADPEGSSASRASKSAPSGPSERSENASTGEEKSDEPTIGSGSSSKLKPKKEDSFDDADAPASSSDEAMTASNSAAQGQRDHTGAGASSTGTEADIASSGGSDENTILPPGADPVAPSKEKPAAEAPGSSSESSR